MAETNKDGKTASEAQPGTDSKLNSSGAEKVDSQDKQKDKPDSGQNEDG